MSYIRNRYCCLPLYSKKTGLGIIYLEHQRMASAGTYKVGTGGSSGIAGKPPALTSAGVPVCSCGAGNAARR